MNFITISQLRMNQDEWMKCFVLILLALTSLNFLYLLQINWLITVAEHNESIRREYQISLFVLGFHKKWYFRR